jgi:hypothetical protein
MICGPLKKAGRVQISVFSWGKHIKRGLKRACAEVFWV